MFDMSDLEPRRFTAFGPAPFPDPRDTELDDYVTGLRRSGASGHPVASVAASEEGRRVLRVYAERAATRAVRERRRDLLVLASVAVVAGGLDQYEREALMAMPLIDDASTRLGVELADVFEEASAALGPAGAESLRTWLSRKPENRTLACMGYVAIDDDAGFRYEFIAW